MKIKAVSHGMAENTNPCLPHDLIVTHVCSVKYFNKRVSPSNREFHNLWSQTQNFSSCELTSIDHIAFLLVLLFLSICYRCTSTCWIWSFFFCVWIPSMEKCYGNMRNLFPLLKDCCKFSETFVSAYAWSEFGISACEYDWLVVLVVLCFFVCYAEVVNTLRLQKKLGILPARILPIESCLCGGWPGKLPRMLCVMWVHGWHECM